MYNQYIYIVIIIYKKYMNNVTPLNQMHKTELVRALETAIEDAEKCASVIQQLDLNKMRTRTRHHDPKYRLSIHELTLFAAEIDGLACVLPEGWCCRCRKLFQHLIKNIFLACVEVACIYFFFE